MENANPFEKPVGKNEFNGFWIPAHNAKVMKAGIESNKAPFLPNAEGEIKAEAIYSIGSGYCLPGNRLIPVQFEKFNKGYTSNVVATKSLIKEMENSLKDGEKGVMYNFKGKDDAFHTATLYFPEQTEKPDDLIAMANNSIEKQENLKDIQLTIGSSEPVEYLGAYLAACKGGMKLSVDQQVAEDFKNKIMVNVENDIKKADNRDKNIESVGNILFNADKRGTEILRTLAQEQNRSQEPKKQEQEMEVCF